MTLKTIGIVVVALAASVVAFPMVTNAATCRRANSAIIPGGGGTIRDQLSLAVTINFCCGLNTRRELSRRCVAIYFLRVAPCTLRHPVRYTKGGPVTRNN